MSFMPGEYRGPSSLRRCVCSLATGEENTSAGDEDRVSVAVFYCAQWCILCTFGYIVYVHGCRTCSSIISDQELSASSLVLIKHAKP